MTFGTVMFVVCVLFVLLLQINHLARSIIVDTVINRVGRNWTQRSGPIQPRPTRTAVAKTNAPDKRPPASGFEHSGYVQTIDFGHLTEAAATANAQIVLLVRPGHHLLRGGSMQGLAGGALSDALRLSLRNSVVIGRRPDLKRRHRVCRATAGGDCTPGPVARNQ